MDFRTTLFLCIGSFVFAATTSTNIVFADAQSNSPAITVPKPVQSTPVASNSSDTQTPPDVVYGPPHPSEVVAAASQKSDVPDRELLPLGVPRRTKFEDSESAIPSPTNPQWVIQTVIALVVVLGLIFLGRYGLSAIANRNGRAQHPALEVLGRVGIAPRQQVILLRLGFRVLVVGDSSSGLRTLADLTDPEEVSGVLASTAANKSTSITRGFNDLIRRFTNDYSDEQDIDNRNEGIVGDQFNQTRHQVHGLLSKIRLKNQEAATRD